MDHNLPLITTLASGFTLALIFGFAAARLKMPALVGYLLAGILIGPATPGFIADMNMAAQLSEIGVMLLMFGVGLHFSLEDLLSVRRIAVIGAAVQMAVATLLGALLASSWGWPLLACGIFGLALSCASTVVLLKALEKHGALESMNGRIAIGWLVVEDIATIFALILLPPLTDFMHRPEGLSGDLWVAVAKTALQIAGFITLMLVVASRLLPMFLSHIARTGSRELFTLAVVTAAISIAFGAAKLFGVSFALGAFFAGSVMRESEFSHRAAEETLPLRDAFAVLFFVSVGMLFDPQVLVDMPLQILAVVFIIMVVNPAVAMALVLTMRYPLGTALTVAASLAQIGEFSFILTGLGVSLGVLPEQGRSLILAGAFISIVLNSLLFRGVAPLHAWALRRSPLARRLAKPDDPFSELPLSTDSRYLQGQVVLAGYGRVGERIAESLQIHGIPYVVAEESRERVETLRNRGIPAVYGDATDPSVLIQAHVAHAALLIVATPDPLGVRLIADTARKLNPRIEVVMRTHSEDEYSRLTREKIGTVFFGEEVLAKDMAAHVLQRFPKAKPRPR